jgi:TRAP transporter TAXI family solute receptor
MLGQRSSPGSLWLSAIAGTFILAALVAAVIGLGPLPPRIVVMSTGTPGSDYDLFARRYQAVLKRSGVQLRLLPSAGAVENLRRLNDPRSNVSVAFAQGGLTSEAQSPRLESLGTMFFEPFWFFSRAQVASRLENLRGRKVSIGPEGSGTRALATQFLALNGIEQSFAQWLALPGAAAGDALLQGQIDAAALVTSPDSAVVRRLLASSDVNIAGFPRADAYVALYPYLSKLTLPAGVGNLATNRPPTDVTLVAPKASLIVRQSMHPAVQYLLLEAAAQIHSAPSIFQQADRFPAAERGDVPLSKDASAFYKTGPPFLQRYLPFWLAVFASRLLVLLIPLVGIVYPLLRFTPALYGWSMRRRIFRLYGELKFIESELEARGGGSAAPDLQTRLQRLDDRVNQIHMPFSFAPFLYQLRTHIALVRSRLPQDARERAPT